MIVVPSEAYFVTVIEVVAAAARAGPEKHKSEDKTTERQKNILRMQFPSCLVRTCER
jgi:hypothetical protein